MANIIATVGNDFTDGIAEADIIRVLEGDDSVRGFEDNDVIEGNLGNDFLNGNWGDDTLWGGEGEDIVRGGKNDDMLFGDAGDDSLYGDLGADTLAGGEGGDTFFLRRNSLGIDVITDFTPGVDRFGFVEDLSASDLSFVQGTGVNINDTIIIDNATGQILAIVQGVNSSAITGNSPNDDNQTPSQLGTFEFSAAEFRVNEGVMLTDPSDAPIENNVTIVRTGSSTGAATLTITLTDGTATAPNDYDNTPIQISFADGETQKTVEIPVVFDDILEGDETVNLTLSSNTPGAIAGSRDRAVLQISACLEGDSGDNLLAAPLVEQPICLSGFAGDDSLEGGSGNDLIDGGDGNDLVEGFRGNDSVFGGNGNDVLFGYRFFDLGFSGQNEVDTLTGGAGADRFVLGYLATGGNYVPYSIEGEQAADNLDYAIITDFNPGEGDLIQIVGPDRGLQSATTILTASPAGLPEGTAIYVQTAGERFRNDPAGLIAIVEGVSYNDTLTPSDDPPQPPFGFTYDLAASIPSSGLTPVS